MSYPRGVDVSNWQGRIRWFLIRPRFAFAAMKATEGTTYVDPTFGRNWSLNAGRGRFRRIVYHYARPSQPPEPQADLMVHAVDNAGGFVRSVDRWALDLEVGEGLFGRPLWDWAERFAARVHSHGWNVPRGLLYTGRWFYDACIQVPANVTDHPFLTAAGLWLAEYRAGAPPTPLPGWDRVVCWQWTSRARVLGIGGLVDGDLWVGPPGSL